MAVTKDRSYGGLRGMQGYATGGMCYGERQLDWILGR